MRSYFPKRTSGAWFHSLSNLYDVPVGFAIPPHLRQCIALFEVTELLAVAQYRMLCPVLIENHLNAV